MIRPGCALSTGTISSAGARRASSTIWSRCLRPTAFPAGSASRTPAGQPTAHRRCRTPTRTPPTRSRWSTTASSRIFARCAPSSIASGRHLESETDTEVVAHLISREIEAGVDPQAAVAGVLKRLHGAFAFAIIFRRYPDLMIGARRGSPLVLGYGHGEMFLGSDELGLAPLTSQIAYLEEGDWVVLSRAGAQVYDAEDRPVARSPHHLDGQRCDDRQGQSPPLHGKGDPRAADGGRADARAISSAPRCDRRAAGAAVRPLGQSGASAWSRAAPAISPR